MMRSQRSLLATLLPRLRAGCFLLAFALSGNAEAADFTEVTCEGLYPKHLQGVCTDEAAAIYWSFTTVLVFSQPVKRSGSTRASLPTKSSIPP